MSDAKELLKNFSEQIEKILIEFSIDEENARKLMESLKSQLSEKYSVNNNDKEIFDICLYNALATINTVPGQKKKTGQLLSALTEAKEEIRAIIEYM